VPPIYWESTGSSHSFNGGNGQTSRNTGIHRAVNWHELVCALGVPSAGKGFAICQNALENITRERFPHLKTSQARLMAYGTKGILHIDI
jgi:hypothetical protein